MDIIAVMEERFVIDIDSNGGGKVYGFITTGESWRIVRYDGTSFALTEKIEVI